MGGDEAPGAQFGGELTSGGAVKVGEVGPEIVQLPEGAKIKPLNVAERGDMRSTGQGSSPSIDLSPLLLELKSLKETMSTQQAAISQMKVVINPNRLEVGQMTNSAQLQ
jgi:hypothetical protein